MTVVFMTHPAMTTTDAAFQRVALRDTIPLQALLLKSSGAVMWWPSAGRVVAMYN
jgi:hypothetical protein